MGGDTEICFTFNITDDACVEDKESFEVYLSSSDPYVDVHISSAIIAIWDNDCQFIHSECLPALTNGNIIFPFRCTVWRSV